MSDGTDVAAFKWISPQRRYVLLAEDKSVQSHVFVPDPLDQLAFGQRTKQSIHETHMSCIMINQIWISSLSETEK